MNIAIVRAFVALRRTLLNLENFQAYICVAETFSLHFHGGILFFTIRHIAKFRIFL
jgi:hypothetical protein